MDNWVIIPCHNNVDLLSQALDSILAQTIPVRIFAINNGSTDNTSRLLEGLGHEHVVVHAYPQLGVAGAWNCGLNHVFNAGAERALVVNQDIKLMPETYKKLLEDGGQFVSAVSSNNMDHLKSWKESSADRRPHPDFSCYVISRSYYKRIGPFDEGFYPAWFEDNDYHIRAARAGVELYCIDLPFYHYAAGTMKRASDYDRAHVYNPGFLASKQRFYDKYGIYPGTKEYEELCQPIPSNSVP